MSQDKQVRGILKSIFQDAVRSALPQQVVSEFLPNKPKGRCIVVGAGKASAAMAAALETAWPDVPMSGVIVTRYGHAVSCSAIRIIEAAHPVPDENSTLAAEQILACVEGLSEHDLVIALISGGGSSLMVAPVEGMTLHDKQALNKALLRSGASINEMNVVRQVFSRIKGGKLLEAAHPAHVLTLVISDVPGDDPAMIASGPTVPASDNVERARDILDRYRVGLTAAAKKALSSHIVQIDKVDLRHDLQMIATPRKALESAARCVVENGYTPVVLGDAIEGESREAAKVMAGIARSVKQACQPTGAPAVLLSGGETTVTVGSEGAGRGGRNTEFLLALAIALEGYAGIWAIACDTDGIDGTEDAAGAIITPNTLQRGKQLGLDARDYLARHDSYSYFQILGDLVITGPTFTNVNDIRAILIA